MRIRAISAVRASVNCPPVVSAIARSVSGSGGTGITLVRIAALPEAAAEAEAASDRPLRGPERDGVDREARLLRQRGALHRLEDPSRLRAVREEEDRDQALLVAPLCLRESPRVGRRRGRRGLPFDSGGASIDCLPSSTAVCKRVPDRSSSVDGELADRVDGLLDEIVIRGRRRRDLRFAGEDDEPDADAIRNPLQEEADRLLCGSEPRRLDVLGLHRPRCVHDEDDRRSFARNHPVDRGSSERDQEHDESEREERGAGRTASTIASPRPTRAPRGS